MCTCHIKERASIVRHVRSEDNPADIGSRGCMIDELVKSKLWWHGPNFLQLPEDKWPKEAVMAVDFAKQHINNDLPEDEISIIMDKNSKVPKLTSSLKVAAKSITVADKVESLCVEIDSTRFSKWSKLLMSHSAVLYALYKFGKSAANPSNLFEKLLKLKVNSHQQPSLIMEAEVNLIKQLQQKCPPTVNVQRNLMLKLNQAGLIVCNHRIAATEKTPDLIWLPDCYEVHLLILHIHAKLFHAGPRETLNELRSLYWLCQGKRITSKVINNECQKCKLLKLKPYKMPVMPELPCERTTASAPFKHCGLDYAGPKMIKVDSETKKCWIILFTCFSTRAIHLEVVKGLDAHNFILAFRRFTARRGRPDLIVSDNQSTLKAASTLIEPCWHQNEGELQDFIARERLSWKFIIECAPWMGGFYERLIGLTKKAISHAIGNRILTFDEFNTVVIECETIVNCRPISPVDPEFKPGQAKQLALRPVDFLMPHGNINNGLPYYCFDNDPDFLPKETTGDTLMRLMHKTAAIVERFWKIWSIEYINQLREVNQNFHRQNKIADAAPEIGQVVMIKEENAIRNTWKLGIIEELNSSKDKAIRSAKVKTPNAFNC
uniref:Integrase catalytic domain-containing protein n=1 Tax=Panagrolaimus superbus TaxID=310955 RepID=A0A914YB01_9BILA